MSDITVVAVVSIVTSGAIIIFGTIAPAIAQGLAIMKSMDAVARQPEESATLTRNLFVGIAMIESLAIYCLVISIIIIFTNPYWEFMIKQGVK